MKKWPLNLKATENGTREETAMEKMKPAKIPQKGEPSSFWENREDRHHCGVDLYAPENTGVVSTEVGVVVETGLMTSPEIIHYWNLTYYVAIEHDRGLSYKYGELANFTVNKGDEVEAGHLVGHVGMVLNSDKIDSSCPLYIQKLKNKSPSMLHFEVWKDEAITTHRNYLGGNWFTEEKPENLKDPTKYLESLYS